MKILLTGDYFYNYKTEHKDFSILKSLLSSYDACVLNWEGSFKVGDKDRLRKSVNLEFSSQGINLPVNSILSLSNNHVYDFGVQGLEKTIKAIEQKQYKWFGLQSNVNTFDNFKIISIEDVKICFVGFGWKNEECKLPTAKALGVSNFTKDNIDSTFNNIKKVDYDLLICYCHAGYEFEYYPLPLHVGLSRYLIDQGCDFVYFSHTHSIQPYEMYNEKYIFYGLGNFYLSNLRPLYPKISDKGIVLEIVIENKMISNVKPIDILYNRNDMQTTCEIHSDYIGTHNLGYQSLQSYSEDYNKIRTRKKNPRPIMYFDRPILNSIKYNLWLFIVKITGILRLRKFIKTLLGWN